MADLAVRRLNGLRCLLLAAVLGLGGCAGSSPLGEMFSPDVYTVRAGDTLYAIAWRYERSVNDLVRWNNLDRPDELRPGQRIRLSPPRGGADRAASAEPPSPEPVAEDTGRAESAPAPASTGRQADAAEHEDSAPAAATDAHANAGEWSWPTDGELVGTFGNGRVYGRGIDIAGREGQRVLAAADGTVVYSGRGLQAYGPLIIIRHSNLYLSAYAHNRQLLVDEGDSVRAGQQIAEMGLAPGDEALLHFEIRRDGSPVDPLEYLPARD